MRLRTGRLLPAGRESRNAIRNQAPRLMPDQRPFDATAALPIGEFRKASPRQRGHLPGFPGACSAWAASAGREALAAH